MKKICLSAIFAFLASISVLNAQTVNITYRYMHNGNVWYTEVKEGTIGQPYPEIIAQPDGVKYTSMPTGTVSAAETVDIECAYTGNQLLPFVSDTYNDARWVYLSIKSNSGHLKYVSGQNWISVNGSQTTRPDNTSANYAYQWALVGNPLTGYKLMNRSAGSSMILSSASPVGDGNNGGNTFPTMQTEGNINTSTNNIYWNLTKIATTTTQYFYISRKGESTYMNNFGANGKLAFWTNGAGDGSKFVITPVELLYATTSFDTSKRYMLINRYTGKAMGEGNLWNVNKSADETNCAVSVTAQASNLSAIWQLEASGNGYKLKNYNSGNYLNTTTPSSYTSQGDTQGLPMSGALGGAWYWPLKTDGEGIFYFNATNETGYYTITKENSDAAASEQQAFYDDGYMTIFGSTHGIGSALWELREVTAQTHASSITSGSYYRLVNSSHLDLCMTENDGKLYGNTIDENSYGQIWKLTKSGSSYSLQNALTSKYIQSASTDVQCTTGTSAKYFTTSASTVNGYTVFTFSNGTGLNCNNYNKIVGYNTSADASKWILIPVTVNSTDLSYVQSIMNGNGTNYTTQLANFFSDYACTTLKSNYQSMSDAQLRSAMSSLPTDLQEMAVSVKNNTWNTSEGTTWNQYEKSFRIHNYDIYSDGDTWKSTTNTGSFAHLNNPTGIQAKAGEIIYIFVNSSVNSGATLKAELVVGTDRTGTTKNLSQGYNAICATNECEVFISYLQSSTSTVLSNFPDIKIHIEGGTCNGFFDMHRGHNNNDWAWLKENMFKNRFLHVKGNSTLLNVLLDGVKAENNAVGVMNIWDFIFDTEESFSGCDKWKNEGKYKMMINNFHNIDETDAYRGYPYWSAGNHGTSHPNLNYSGCFNYNTLANSALWEIAHEIGHGHQAPIKSLGTDETSNNVMSQVIQFLAKDNIGTNMFKSAKATRCDGVKALTECFNEEGGSWGYIDYIRRRMNVRGTSIDDNISNRWLFQLWMYFDYLGNYQPSGGNNGFAFIGELYNRLRSSGLIISNSPLTTPSTDYLKMAQYCADITQTDLSEFFEVWGFWKTAPKYGGLTIPDEWGNSTKTDSGNTYYVGGYTIYGFDMSSATSQINSVKNAMKSYSKKGTNIVFIEDRGVGCTLSETMEGRDPQTMGDHGYYGDYSKTITGSYKYSVDTGNNTVTISGGSNAVGFKIYDGSGNLVALSNMNSFRVPATVATNLANGTYTLVAAQGNGADVATEGSSLSTTALTSASQLSNNKAYTIQTKTRGYLSVKNGKTKMGGNMDTYDNNNQITYTNGDNQFHFAFLTYNNNTYLYSVSARKFVDCDGNLTENPGTNDIITVEPTTTTLDGYPLGLRFYKGTNAAVTCINLGGSKQLAINDWGATRGTFGEDGNAWKIVEAAEFDPAEALAILNPNPTITYNLVFNGLTINSTTKEHSIGDDAEAPNAWINDFVTLSCSPTTITAGTTTVTVTATSTAPFEFSTDFASAKWYYMNGHSSYNNRYVSTNGDDIVWNEGISRTDAYKWAFIGNPYDGVKVINKAAGNGKYLQETDPATMGTTAKVWPLRKQTNTDKQGYAGENGFGLWSETKNQYLNTQGSTLKYWGLFDQGSTYWVEDININHLPGITDLSLLDNYKAYVITNARRTWNVTGTAATSMTTTQTFSLNNENLKFAIIKYNNEYYLYNIATQKFLTSGNTLGNQQAVSITATGNANYPWFFSFDSNHNINVDSNGTVLINNWATIDAGNSNAIIEAGEFDPTEALAILSNSYNLVMAEILPYIYDDPTDINSSDASTIGQLFGISESGATIFKTTYASQLSSGIFSNADYEAAKALLDANIIYPQPGKYYLIKNTYNNKYLRVAQGGTRGQVFADLTAEEAAKDASAHIYIHEINSKPYMKTQGQFFNWVYGVTNGYEAYTVENIDKYAHFVSVEPGVGAFSLAFGNGEGSNAKYLGIGFYALKNGTTTVAGSTTDHTNQYAQWIFEEVNTLNVTLNKATAGADRGYATMCLPFDVTLPDNVAAYQLSVEGETTQYAQLTELGSTVAAGTPVVLMDTNPAVTTPYTKTLTIGANEPQAAVGNQLSGSYFSIISDLSASATTYYVLNSKDGNIGFYKLANGSTLAPNRAYIADATLNPEQGRKMVFRFHPDSNFRIENTSLFGDVDGNGSVNTSDVNKLVNFILGKDKDIDSDVSDMDRNNSINISDVTKLVNSILGKE